MASPFIGQIIGFGGNFAPRSWAFCEGQLLAISSNTALFSLLGTMYGGDGRSTFALPDLRARAMVHAGTGQGPGLSPVSEGQRLGVESVVLGANQMPWHTHTATLYAEKKAGGENKPEGNYLAKTGQDTIYAPSGNALVDLAPGSVTVGSTGSHAPIPNTSPGLGIRMIIALQGTYPSRS